MFVPVGTDEGTPRHKFPIVTTALVVINVLVFGFEAFLVYAGGEAALQTFITAFGVVPSAVMRGEAVVLPSYLTLFTSLFVHGGLTHIGFNMLYLFAFGDNVEDRLGSLKYLAFYLLAGLSANLAQIAVDPGSTTPSVGASGAIAGVLAGYLVLFPRGRVRVFFFLGPLSRVTRISALLYIAFWFVTQFFSGIGALGVATAETGGVAYWAHIGGFVFGLAAMLLCRVGLKSIRSASASGGQDLFSPGGRP